MKILRLLFALLFSAQALADVTYGELAKTQVEDSVAQLADVVKVLNDRTEPHEAKALRKIIGRLRDMVDIFVYALPVDGPTDFYPALRSNLDRAGFCRCGQRQSAAFGGWAFEAGARRGRGEEPEGV